MNITIRLAHSGEERECAECSIASFNTKEEPSKSFCWPKLDEHKEYFIQLKTIQYRTRIYNSTVVCATVERDGKEKIVGVAGWQLPGQIMKEVAPLPSADLPQG